MEVKLYNRIIDLLFVEKDDNYPKIAMEFKIKDWKKALIQALSYQLVADYVYIVIYLKYRDLIDQEIIKNNGVGLIIANSRRYEILIKPRKNKINDENLKRKIIKNYNN